ncbi:MAG: NETI motif-containing protein [Bacillaceae bacterium]
MAKRKFEVEENETIDDCLTRMSKEGYIPIRRLEEPIFREVTSKDGVEVCGRKIVFVGIRKDG